MVAQRVVHQGLFENQADSGGARAVTHSLRQMTHQHDEWNRDFAIPELTQKLKSIHTPISIIQHHTAGVPKIGIGQQAIATVMDANAKTFQLKGELQRFPNRLVVVHEKDQMLPVDHRKNRPSLSATGSGQRVRMLNIHGRAVL
jgi:hypothetical protein